MYETYIRSIIKTFIYRLVTLTISTLIIYFVSEVQLIQSFGLSLLLNVVMMFVYYLNERIWNKVKYGKIPLKKPGKILSLKRFAK